MSNCSERATEIREGFRAGSVPFSTALVCRRAPFGLLESRTSTIRWLESFLRFLEHVIKPYAGGRIRFLHTSSCLSPPDAYAVGAWRRAPWPRHAGVAGMSSRLARRDGNKCARGAETAKNVPQPTMFLAPTMLAPGFAEWDFRRHWHSSFRQPLLAADTSRLYDSPPVIANLPADSAPRSALPPRRAKFRARQRDPSPQKLSAHKATPAVTRPVL